MESVNLERKNEYTTYLINILKSIIYDGFQSIYNDGLKISSHNDEIKIFQLLIKTIPEWTDNILTQEVNRINIVSKCNFLNDLLNAIIKANISLLSNNTTNQKEFTIEFKKFIHYCYIITAKEFYIYPELFYHLNKPIEIKRNQREILNIIDNSIRNAIRKILPIDKILKDYLNDKLLFNDKLINKLDLNNIDNNLQGGHTNNNIIPRLTSEKSIQNTEGIIKNSNNNSSYSNNNSSYSNKNSSYSNKNSSYSNKNNSYSNKNNSYSNNNLHNKTESIISHLKQKLIDSVLESSINNLDTINDSSFSYQNEDKDIHNTYNNEE